MRQLKGVPGGPALGRGEPPESVGRLRDVPLVDGTHLCQGQSPRLAGAESREEGPSNAVTSLDYVRVRSECGPGRDEVVELGPADRQVASLIDVGPNDGLGLLVQW